MTQALRNTVQSIAVRLYSDMHDRLPVSNAGLELDKYLEVAEPSGEKAHLDALFDRVCAAAAPAIYAGAFERWRVCLQAAYGDGVAMAQIPATSRIAVGLGGESVHESAIRLHRLYGTPIIPGTALKGLAQSYTWHELAPGDGGFLPRVLDRTDGGGNSSATWHTILFGDQGDAGHIIWLDAWYVPDTAPGNRPLRRDVVTVHHPQYYGHQGDLQKNPPWDFDDPNPNPFISAAGSFLFAVAGPTAEWTQLAWNILTHSLHDYGVGAKTSSGYGRFALPPRQVSAGARAVIEQIDTIPGIDDRSQRKEVVSQVRVAWESIRDTNPDDGMAIATHWITTMRKIDRNWTNNRPWSSVLLWVQQGDPGWK